MVAPDLPTSEIFQKIFEITHSNPVLVKTVKELRSQTDAGYSEVTFLGCLKYFAQVNYIERIPKRKDFTFSMSDSFSITGLGIKQWCDWFNKKPPKEKFY